MFYQLWEQTHAPLVMRQDFREMGEGDRKREKCVGGSLGTLGTKK